ncbi:MAG: hypothetical protein DRH90_20630 [Deltaproteobacteria bacterium]|nr:MAG: hypothetical protein DRH90_20630 [Deltaproteobacteria bacterium]RLC12499.1 MAG: hypothetical protein DRI24_17300 [Deltaproteobacteria bacterium]
MFFFKLLGVALFYMALLIPKNMTSSRRVTQGAELYNYPDIFENPDKIYDFMTLALYFGQKRRMNPNVAKAGGLQSQGV